MVEQHLLGGYGTRRPDSITAEDLAALVPDVRQQARERGHELPPCWRRWLNYKFATRRLGLSGTNPTTLMLPSERAKISLGTRRPIFPPEQIVAEPAVGFVVALHS